MTKKQVERYMHLRTALLAHGITNEEINTLLRCERTLRRWGEQECGTDAQVIERDEITGRPFRVYHGGDRGSYHYPIADRETGAIRRAQSICVAHGLLAYHQGDCRGCNLYIIRPGDIPEGASVEGYYTRGIAVSL